MELVSGAHTHCGFTRYRVDPEHVDDFIAAVHSAKMQQMGDEVGVMQSNALLRSLDDPEDFINLTYVCVETPEDAAEMQTMSGHALRLEILEDVQPYLLEEPQLDGFETISILTYK